MRIEPMRNILRNIVQQVTTRLGTVQKEKKKLAVESSTLVTKNYFPNKDFRCKCGCGGLIVCGKLINMLNETRKIYGKPMKVTSGYRCKKHN